MSDERLYQLYKLHLIDKKLFETKSRAGALDVGKRELAAAQKIAADTSEIRQKFKDLGQTAVEIEQRETISEDKLNKFQVQLYDGSMTNPREVENVQKEIEMLEELVVKLDDDRKAILASREEIREEAEAAIASIQAYQKQAAKKRAEAQEEHIRLQEEFNAAGAVRPDALKEVEPNLLRDYNNARKKTGGTGMTLVTEGNTCSECGMDVPEKPRVFAIQGKTVLCESCGRILFVKVHGEL